ncbi:MAG: hypothetical protein ABGW78_14730 [Pirellulales bacterium]
MKILIIDHANCDPPHARSHQLCLELAQHNVQAMVCGPASQPILAAQPLGIFGIHLHDIAAASQRLYAAIDGGSAEALLAAIGSISPRLLGLLRETARQGIAESVDAVNPDVIFVMHAGILAHLAIETGVPVALYVAASDLEHAHGAMKDFVLTSIGSCGGLATDSSQTTAIIHREWVDDIVVRKQPLLIAEENAASEIVAICQQVIQSRA